MPGPPDNISPSELWAHLQTLPRPYKILDYPRKDPVTGVPVGQLAMWPLTQEEQMICNAEAERFTREILKSPAKKDEANLGYEHTFGNESAIQVLFRACRDPNEPKRALFPTPKLMREYLPAEEVGALFSLYMSTQVELGPIVTDMSEEEMEAWIRALVEGGKAYPFVLLSLETQTSLVRFMASRLVSYWTATSSAGSPPEERPQGEEAEAQTEPPERQT